MEKYRREFDRIGYATLEVLPFLKGRKYDDVARAFIHSLRPSYVRVVRHGECETLDSIRWRVTVRLGEDDTVKGVRQGVEVALPDEVKHGADLMRLARVSDDFLDVLQDLSDLRARIGELDADQVSRLNATAEGILKGLQDTA